MDRIGRKLAGFLIAVFVALWMCAPALAMDHEVTTMQKDGVGTYLTDAKGMTLYWFSKDSPGKSACSGHCVGNWPVYFREKVKAGTGLHDADFGTITRGDGKKQTTFRGYPLYYWAGDKAKGDTNGQGMMGAWHVIDPSNFPPKM